MGIAGAMPYPTLPHTVGLETSHCPTYPGLTGCLRATSRVDLNIPHHWAGVDSSAVPDRRL